MIPTMSSLFFSSPLRKEELTTRIRPRENDVRGAFFRDTTAIIHSNPFRRLKHKTQVFFTPENDHICTRIEHVLHVASVAATICRSLNLDADLAWAIGLGHDLGHTPFGHVGEKIVEEIRESPFAHELYSLRVVDKLINHGRGLNLTYAVRDGIINHCGEQFEQAIVPDFEFKELSSIAARDRYPSTWEGCVVRMSDKIAYLGRDFEDAVKLRMIGRDSLPPEVSSVLGNSNGEIIDSLVNDIIQTSLKTGSIGFSEPFYEALLVFREFNYSRIYLHELLSEYYTYFRRILFTLYEYLHSLYQRLGEDQKGYLGEGNTLAARFGEYLAKMSELYAKEKADGKTRVIDYLAGMTDDFALAAVGEIMVPKRFESKFDQLLFERRREFDGSSQ
jgi:dGTPase